MSKEQRIHLHIALDAEEMAKYVLDGEAWTRSVSAKPTPPVTVESLQAAIEQLRKEFPEMEQCQHDELITSRHLPPSDQGTPYLCRHCSKLFVIPGHLLGTREKED